LVDGGGGADGATASLDDNDDSRVNLSPRCI
jgi:hypothetical protein